jgi:hypothetical protein
MPDVDGPEFPDGLLVFVLLDGRSDVQAGAAHANGFGELPLVAWLDLFQGG